MKTMRYILFAAVSVIVAASCTKEQAGDLQQPTGGVDVKAVFEAVPEDDMSKALLQPNGGLQWEDGDLIGVYQTGKYAEGLTRDNSKNIFTSDGTCVFEGEIANYHPRVGKEGIENRYTAVYPADNDDNDKNDRCDYATATGTANVTIPSQQTGQLSDFKKSAVYFGYIRESASTVSYDADNATLTFLQPFNMFCITPVLKFNVPAELKVRKIVVSAKNAEDDVKISGQISGFKPYSASTINTTSAKTTVTVENGGEVLAGDVYVALAPDLEVAGQSHPLFKSSATSLVLNLFLASGASASLTLPLTGEVVAGTIKNLPSLPTSIDWDYPEGPGISAIEINKTAITSTSGSSLSSRTRILLTPENSESTITYRSRTSLSGLLGSTIMNPYSSTSGILRSDAETPENYLEINVATEGYEDYSAYACTWILNKNYGFGKVLDTEEPTLDPEVNSTFPTDGSYLYGLSFTYLTAPKNTSSFNIPRLGSDGLYLYNGSTSNTPSKYWSGTLNIKVPQSGTAKLFFDCNRSKGSSRTITIKSGTETKATLGTGDSSSGVSYAVVSTDSFDVAADDILVISTSKDVAFESITLLWQPTVTEETTSTESYSAKTSYGN